MARKGERRGVYRVSVGKRDHLVDLSVDGRIILTWIKKLGGGGMDWINLAYYRGRWRALVNAVTNLRVP